MSAQTDRKARSEGAAMAFRGRPHVYTVEEVNAGYPVALMALTFALRAVGWACRDDRVTLALPPL